MNEPHENLDHDPFADDAQRRPSRLRRVHVRDARHRQRARCGAAGPGSSAHIGALAAKPIRHLRPCSNAARGPLR
ncbi:hypothetical protein DSM104299_01444 [Baekduia alba]|uniref:hypothetical protein n=1 Tax=Baekduia alba TaxID=2997333 RepID=UPI002342490D|nr:hypothetical protein [Baekduia alba]WCB92745.1 hypothetical protein DSM104299_01444 [Baekduia alba]